MPWAAGWWLSVVTAFRTKGGQTLGQPRTLDPKGPAKLIPWPDYRWQYISGIAGKTLGLSNPSHATFTSLSAGSVSWLIEITTFKETYRRSECLCNGLFQISRRRSEHHRQTYYHHNHHHHHHHHHHHLHHHHHHRHRHHLSCCRNQYVHHHNHRHHYRWSILHRRHGTVINVPPPHSPSFSPSSATATAASL